MEGIDSLSSNPVTTATSAASGAQGAVDAALAKIGGIEAAITSLCEAIATIQQAIAILEAELASLKAPRPEDFQKTETRMEGSPPRRVQVRVLDSAAFNRAMSEYLQKLQSLQSKIQTKRQELAQKENALAQKQRELSAAKDELARAQRELEKALRRDREALEEAQRRYRQELERLAQAEKQALEAQAQAQRAQDDLQRTQEAIERMNKAAMDLGGYSEEQARKLREDIAHWSPSSGKPPPYAISPSASQEAFDTYVKDTDQAKSAALLGLASAKNHLPRLEGGQLLPPVSSLSTQDYLELTPHLASVEDGVTAQEAGLLTGLADAGGGQVSGQALMQMVEAWTQAGFSQDQIKTAVGQILGPQSWQDMSEADRQEAELVLAKASTDSTALLEWLEEHPDPILQAQMFDMMGQYGMVGQMVDRSAQLGEEAQQMLAQGLSLAYLSGSLSDEEFRNSIHAAGMGETPGELHRGLAEVVALTGNTHLIETFVLREVEVMRESLDNCDVIRAPAAALALAALPPGDLQSFLAAHPNEVREVVANVNTGDIYTYEPTDALGKLLDAARAIVPPTAETLDLFRIAVPVLGENATSREAAAQFFLAHGDAILRDCTNENGAIKVEDQVVLATFFAHTLFSDPSFASEQALRDSVSQRLATMLSELNRRGGDGVPESQVTEEVEDMARLMGSLVGVIENGYLMAVRHLKEENEAIDGMVDMLFKVESLLPTSKLGSLAGVAGIGQDIAVDGIKDWLKGLLHHRAEDPRQAVPFHAMFYDFIESNDLATLYDGARGSVYDNALVAAASAEP